MLDIYYYMPHTCKVIYTHDLIYSSQYTYKFSIIILILQMKKLVLKESVTYLKSYRKK